MVASFTHKLLGPLVAASMLTGCAGSIPAPNPGPGPIVNPVNDLNNFIATVTALTKAACGVAPVAGTLITIWNAGVGQSVEAIARQICSLVQSTGPQSVRHSFRRGVQVLHYGPATIGGVTIPDVQVYATRHHGR